MSVDGPQGSESFLSLVSLSQRLNTAIGEAFSGFDLSRSEHVMVLARLASAGPLPMDRLVGMSLVDGETISAAVRVLEAHGLVSVDENAVVSLTPSGHEGIAATVAGIRAATDAGELARIGRLLAGEDVTPPDAAS